MSFQKFWKEWATAQPRPAVSLEIQVWCRCPRVRDVLVTSDTHGALSAATRGSHRSALICRRCDYPFTVDICEVVISLRIR